MSASHCILSSSTGAVTETLQLTFTSLTLEQAAPVAGFVDNPETSTILVVPPELSENISVKVERKVREDSMEDEESCVMCQA